MRSVRSLGELVAKHPGVALLASLCAIGAAVPFWWATDKMLQLSAARRLETTAFANLRDEGFLAETFDLDEPLRYSRTEFARGTSLTDNDFARQLRDVGRPAKRPFDMFLILSTPGSENVTVEEVYRYQIEICDGWVCPYDPDKAIPAPEAQVQDIIGGCVRKEVPEGGHAFGVSTVYSLCVDGLNSVASTAAFIWTEARNPFDRLWRALGGAQAPEYARRYSYLQIDFATGVETYKHGALVRHDELRAAVLE